MKKNSKSITIEIRIPHFMYIDLKKLQCIKHTESLSKLIKNTMSDEILRCIYENK